MKKPTTKTHLPDDLITEILARLPLSTISRFKSVCKTWKSKFESVFFRRLFLSLHKNSSSSWSLTNGPYRWEDFIGLYGCDTWDLPKSPVSYIPVLPDLGPCGCAYSNGLVLIEGTSYGCYVGNPVLQQWVEIPACPHECGPSSSVTHVDEDGVVLSFKVIRLSKYDHNGVHMYSSETGIWTCKRIKFPNYAVYSQHMSLNGMLYFLSAENVNADTPHEVIAHDFYSESDQARAIPLPDLSSHKFKGALTTSRGYLMYIKTFSRNKENVLKVWKLSNVGLEDECWQILWETPLSFTQYNDIYYYAPMTMHPFDSDIVFIWNQQNRCVVSFNVRTQNYTIVRDVSEGYNDDCFMNQSICQKHMDLWVYIGSHDYDDIVFKTTVSLSQFVLPRWMESVPCPPHVEMIDTTSLLSYIASVVEKTKRDKGQDKKSMLV